MGAGTVEMVRVAMYQLGRNIQGRKKSYHTAIGLPDFDKHIFGVDDGTTLIVKMESENMSIGLDFDIELANSLPQFGDEGRDESSRLKWNGEYDPRSAWRYDDDVVPRRHRGVARLAVVYVGEKETQTRWKSGWWCLANGGRWRGKARSRGALLPAPRRQMPLAREN